MKKHVSVRACGDTHAAPAQPSLETAPLSNKPYTELAALASRNRKFHGSQRKPHTDGTKDGGGKISSQRPYGKMAARGSINRKCGVRKRKRPWKGRRKGRSPGCSSLRNHGGPHSITRKLCRLGRKWRAAGGPGIMADEEEDAPVSE